MTINTSPLHNGPGNIFNDQVKSNAIDISWTASSTLLFSFKIDEVNELRETNELTEGQNYDLKVRFDGSQCQAYLDGNGIGAPIDCSSGLGNTGSPLLCYNNIHGNWIGMVANLHLEHFEGEFSSLVHDVVYSLIISNLINIIVNQFLMLFLQVQTLCTAQQIINQHTLDAFPMTRRRI